MARISISIQGITCTCGKKDDFSLASCGHGWDYIPEIRCDACEKASKIDRVTCVRIIHEMGDEITHLARFVELTDEENAERARRIRAQVEHDSREREIVRQHEAQVAAVEEAAAEAALPVEEILGRQVA